MSDKVKLNTIFISGLKVPVYTTALLPDATTHEGYVVYDSTATCLKVSDGVTWQSVGEGDTLNDQTGTSYTLVLTDAGKTVTMNNGSANTLTIPANSSVAFPIGTKVEVIQKGAGQTTIAITTDTLSKAGATAKAAAQYSVLRLRKITSTVWVLSGDVASS